MSATLFFRKTKANKPEVGINEMNLAELIKYYFYQNFYQNPKKPL